jgi:hypothetical protein
MMHPTQIIVGAMLIIRRRVRRFKKVKGHMNHPCTSRAIVLLTLLATCSLFITACDERRTMRRDDAGAQMDGASPEVDASVDPIDSQVRDASGHVHDAGESDASIVCSDTMFDPPYPDAVVGDMTDPSSCSGCASFEAITIDRGDTTARVRGRAVGTAVTCRWYLRSPTCGGTSGAFDPGEFTSFDVTLPLFCGQNRLQLVCESAAGKTIATRDIEGPACTSMRDLQITLSWGEASNDQELHLVRAGGRINDPANDCTWFTCVNSSPDWGVAGDDADNPRKDIDDTGTYGPENIFLSNASGGRYDVLVEYWGSGSPDSPEVTMTIRDSTVWRGTHAMNPHDVWHVGYVEFPSGRFTPVDVVTPCATSWRTGGSMGCGLPLP